ncbi:MAG: anthranilate synthase component I family protein [Candidatus Bipolaricaulia bacterium]
MKLIELEYQDPFPLYEAIYRNYEHSFILESAPGPERLAEYTFIGFDPTQVIELADGQIRVDGVLAEGMEETGDPLGYLRSLLSQYAIEDRRFKYVGGLVGYISYDFVGYLEDIPNSHANHFSFPDFQFGLYLDGLIYDHKQGRMYYFSHGEDRLERIRLGFAPQTDFACEALTCDTGRERFIDSVDRAKRYIKAGDIYQAVLSKELSSRFSGDLFNVYRAMRKINPSPYMYYVCLGPRKIVGSSPEMLVAVHDGMISTYPIAGTRPIGATEAERRAYEQEVLNDEKERAEHNMLVDLARNDVGRVSRYGSVWVPEYMVVERFSHVQHIVSRVEGQLTDGRDALDAFAALFPAGTVSGAPKIRAMEIIDELEIHKRGPYAGVVGYFSFNGNMDSAITIRTLCAEGNRLFIRAGAGIVADSVGAREWDETDYKLAALRKAIRLGEKGEGDQDENLGDR